MQSLITKQRVLSPSQLKRLSDHKYSCTSVSLLDPILQPWWNWLVSKLPKWLAPNLITLTGLIVNIVTTLILVWYSPDAKIEAPRWAFALCALGLFVYQSLDAIDGKQARRTGTSSPLGELFDHGCDSISTVFVALSACIAVRLGYFPTWMFFQCICAMTLFYCAHWQTYVSGTLKFGYIDVTEAQFTIMLIHIISAIYGPSIWQEKIPFIYFEMKFLIGITTVVVASFTLYQNFIVIFTGGVGKNGSTVAFAVITNVRLVLFVSSVIGVGCYFHCMYFMYVTFFDERSGSGSGTSVLSPIIPFTMVIVPAFVISSKSIEYVYQNHPALYLLAFGMLAAKVTNKLVVAHMTKSELHYFDSALIGPLMLFLNQYFNFFFTEYVVLWMCLLWVTADLLCYSGQVCVEICDHLKIQLFRIPYKNDSVAEDSDSSTSSIKTRDLFSNPGDTPYVQKLKRMCHIALTPPSNREVDVQKDWVITIHTPEESYVKFLLDRFREMLIEKQQAAWDANMATLFPEEREEIEERENRRCLVQRLRRQEREIENYYQLRDVSDLIHD